MRRRWNYYTRSTMAALLVWAGQLYAQSAASPLIAATNGAQFFPVDLSRFVTMVSSNAPQGSTWSYLPRGQQVFQGVPFQIDGKFEITGTELLRSGTFVPPKVTGIPIGRKAERLVLLHGTGWTEKEGTPLGKIVLHYAKAGNAAALESRGPSSAGSDGPEESLRIVYGVHVRNWYEEELFEDRFGRKKKPIADPNSVIAWSGNEDDPDRGTPFRLYRTTFINPRPNDAIESIDFVSFFSHAAPIIVGLTLQNGGPEPTGLHEGARRLLKKGSEHPDSAYTRNMAVRAVASDSGTALTNANLWVELTDDTGPHFFGAYRADAAGTMTFDYPPRETVSLNLLVKAPNRAPLSVSPGRESDGRFPHQLSLKLKPGASIGGIVQDEAGKPVDGAEILISSVWRTKAKNYSAVDFDRVRSDSGGRWQSSSMPGTFSNLVLQVTHPEFRAGTFQQPVTNAEPTVGASKGQPAQSRTDPSAATRSRTTFAERLAKIANGGSTVVITNQSPSAATQNKTNQSLVTVAATNLIGAEELLAHKAVLTMRRGLIVQGLVKDETSRPLTNAEVHFFENLPSAKSKRTMRTGADGRFSFVSTLDSGEAAVAVLAKGFAPRYEAFFLEAASNPFDFQMGKGSTVQARIMDTEQHPIAGMNVKLEQWHNTQLLNFRTVTDTNGSFSWDTAPEGPLVFSFSKTNVYTMRASLNAGMGLSTYTVRRMSAASGLVLDAETKKPIEEFTVIKGHSYSPGEPIRWQRYSGNISKGRNGRYNVRLDDYYNGQSKIMIEAPGYIPVMSPAFTNAGWFTNNFELKKGAGIAGTILLPSGEPAVNCSVIIVDPGNSGYMDQPGDFRMNMSGYDHARTDLQGRFQFPPKAETQTLLAAHAQGFAQVSSDRLPADGKITLQPWGHVEGVVKVGKKIEPGEMVALDSMYHRGGEPDGRQSPPVNVYLKAPPDAQGRFHFDKVPPGDRIVYVQYSFRSTRNGSIELSHGTPIEVKSGQTSDVVIGGTGRTVIGKVKVIGGEVTDVDWRRDVHHLNLRLPGDPDQQPMNMPAMNSDDERQKFYQDRNERIRAFWRTDKGRELERKQRNYCLLFDTNGVFHIDNVPPGTYDLNLHPTDPGDEDNNYRQLGSLLKQITVPDGPADQPFDSGTHELHIRRTLRIGQKAPSFEAQSLDGKAVKLQDFKGKYVLLDFCAKWSGSYASQVATLKSLYDTYGKDGRLVIVSLSVDYDEKQAREIMTESKAPWTFCYLGQMGQTQVPAMFGVEGIPHAILISPEGLIVNKSLQGTYMKTAVKRAVEAKTTTAKNTP